MLASLSDADDAVQEAWLRLERAGPNEVQNLGGWLTTVVARVPGHAAIAQVAPRGVRRRAHAHTGPWRAGQLDA